MTKVLITGGLGLLGSNLAKECIKRGYETTILSRSNKKIKNINKIKNKVNLILKDIREIDEEVKDKDYIFHLASTVDNYHIKTDPYLDIKINCCGTISLLEACKKHNPDARIIFSSTFFVNGNLKNLPANSKSPCNPLGLYPATKLAAENFCKIYNQLFDLKPIIARMTNVFGENEKGDNKKKAAFNFLIKSAMEDKQIPVYGKGNFVRDYIYVEDVISGLMLLAEKGTIGETYYIGRGEGISFNKLVNKIIDKTKSGKIKYIDPPEFHKKIGITNFFCDNTSLKKLGWNPKISIDEGIKKTIEYYNKQ